LVQQTDSTACSDFIRPKDKARDDETHRRDKVNNNDNTDQW